MKRRLNRSRYAALLYKRLVEAESDVQRQQELAAQYTEELKAVSGKITDSVEQIKNYETEIAGLQKEIGQANENLRNRQNAYHREYSRLESPRTLRSVTMVMGTVSVV